MGKANRTNRRNSFAIHPCHRGNIFTRLAHTQRQSRLRLGLRPRPLNVDFSSDRWRHDRPLIKTASHYYPHSEHRSDRDLRIARTAGEHQPPAGGQQCEEARWQAGGRRPDACTAACEGVPRLHHGADQFGRVGHSQRVSKPSIGRPWNGAQLAWVRPRGVATVRAARARPDGYTICLGYMDTNVLNGAFYSLSYNVLDDLVPISPINTSPFALFARKTMPAADLNECVSWLKTNPDRASAGIITLGARLITELLQCETGTRFALVPYRGGAPVVQDLAAGQIDVVFAPPVFLPLARSGNIKVYAVTSDMRITLVAPDIPIFTERGLPALSFSAWCGLFGPRGTPRDVVGKLNAAIIDALADPAVRYRTVAKGRERLTVLLAARQDLFIRQAIRNVQGKRIAPRPPHSHYCNSRPERMSPWGQRRLCWSLA